MIELSYMVDLSCDTKERIRKVLSLISDFSVVALFYFSHIFTSTEIFAIPFFVFAICALHGLFLVFNLIFSNEFMLVPLKIAKFSASLLAICSVTGFIPAIKNNFLFAAFYICLISFLLFDARPRLSFSRIHIALIPSFVYAIFCVAKNFGSYNGLYEISRFCLENFSVLKNACVFLVVSYVYALLIFILNGRHLNPILSFFKLVFKK